MLLAAVEITQALGRAPFPVSRRLAVSFMRFLGHCDLECKQTQTDLMKMNSDQSLRKAGSGPRVSSKYV